MPESQYLVVNRVIDSLHVRVGSTVTEFWSSQWMTDRLRWWDSHKKYASYEAEDLPVELPTSGTTFHLLKSGHSPYLYWLRNEEIADIYIICPFKWCNQIGRQTGALYVDFRSTFLQTHDLDFVRSFLTSLETDFFFHGSEGCWRKVARMDLAVDTQLPEGLSLSDQYQFVTRARKLEARSEYEEQVKRAIKALTPQMDNKGGSNRTSCAKSDSRGGAQRPPAPLSGSDRHWLSVLINYCESCLEDKGEKIIFDPKGMLETLDVGRKSSPLHAQIYRKDKEILFSSKTYLRDIWEAEGWDLRSPVYRVEFRMSGDFLKECLFNEAGESAESGALYDLRDMETAIAAIPALWAYATGCWMRRLNRSGVRDTHKAAVHPWWQVIQDAWPDSVPTSRARTYAPEESELMKQIFGCILTAAAKEGSDRNPVSAINVLDRIGDFLFSDDFLDLYERRRKRLGLHGCSQWDEDYPGDTEFANKLRRDRIKQFRGS